MDFKRLFALAEREQAIKAELSTLSPDDDYLLVLEEMLHHVSFARRMLDESVGTVGAEAMAGNPHESAFRAAQFYLFGCVSTELTIENFLFQRSEELFVGHEKLHERIKQWKWSPPTMVVKVLRNRAQHGGGMDGDVFLEARTAIHELGEGKTVRFRLFPKVWDGVRRDLNAAGKAYLDEQVLKAEDPVGFLLRGYEEALVALQRDLIRDVPPLVDANVNLRRQQLRAELATIKVELSKPVQ